MRTSLQRDLKKKQGHVVQLIRSAVGMSDVFGFVMDATEDLVLLHFFDSEAFCLNGYDVLRQRDMILPFLRSLRCLLWNSAPGPRRGVAHFRVFLWPPSDQIRPNPTKSE